MIVYQGRRIVRQKPPSLIWQNKLLKNNDYQKHLFCFSNGFKTMNNSRFMSIFSMCYFTMIQINAALLCCNMDTLPLMPIKNGRDWSGGPLNTTFLNTMKKLFGIDLFIETGTYLAETAFAASKVFEEVHTIELDNELFSRACQFFAKCPSVTVHYGNSADKLKNVLHTITNDRRVLLWLDGHWSGPKTACGEVNTPILEELYALKRSGIRNAVILIDDIRLFQKGPEVVLDIVCFGYPELEKIVEIIHSINPSYQCYAYGDSLLAYTDEHITCSPIVKAITTSRLNNACQDELLKAENTIIHASLQEKTLLKHLCEECVQDIGFNQYYHFWYGLTLIKDNQQKAAEHFMVALSGGFQRASIYTNTPIDEFLTLNGQ